MNPRTLLVTGVNGFIGRHVALAAARRGDRVFGTDLHSPDHAPLADLAGYRALTLPDPGLGALLAQTRPDVVIHACGRASVPLSLSDPATDFVLSVDVTFQLLEEVRRHCPRARVLFLSSAAVYGNPQQLPVTEDHPVAPISPYGFHKFMAEQLCREHARVFGLATTVARIFSVYGPGLRRQVVWDLLRKFLCEPVVRLHGSGEETRDFLHVRDAAAALLLLAERAPGQGEVTNVAAGRSLRIRDLAERLRAVLRLATPIACSGEPVPGMPLAWAADISRLRAMGFVPGLDLETALPELAAWAAAELGRA